jgi:hypothetical protein
MKVCILFIFVHIFNVARTQSIINIYREDFDLFFKITHIAPRYDVISLIDTLPETYNDGEYHFYDVCKKDSLDRINFRHIYGSYVNGKKEGVFITERQNYNKSIKKYEIFWQQVITYNQGLKDGFHKEYYMTYQYNRKKELINEVASFTIYIEYKNNLYDGFYMILNDYEHKYQNFTGKLTISFYENGILVKSMKYNGFARKELYFLNIIPTEHN